MNANDTIIALATSPAPSGVGIIRISGDLVAEIAKRFFKAKQHPLTNPRELIFGKLQNSTEVFDHCLAVYFPKPHSFTGEDLLEFHIHGNPVLARKIIRELLTAGLRLAEAGEFTQRAFHNEKIDLLQVEGLGDLINASSERSLSMAGEQLSGKLSQVIGKIGEPLREVYAELTAHIDFPEEDIEPDTFTALSEKLSVVKQELAQLINTYDYGQLVKEGLRVLICGKPNAGKSSLLNLMLRRERAIVTDISGTTRDLIEEELELDGYKFILCDSAGITTADNQVEKIGVQLALDKISWADLIIFMHDAGESFAVSADLLTKILAQDKPLITLLNKADRASSDSLKDLRVKFEQNKANQVIDFSTQNSQGLEELTAALLSFVDHSRHNFADSSPIIANERQLNCLKQASKAVEQAAVALKQGLDLELVCIDLKEAINALTEIIGETSTEDVLGLIFSKFCIGK